MNNFKTFYTSIKKITDSYQDVVTTFQQSYNKTNNRVIPHEGFKNFKLISNIFIIKGLKEGRFLKYFQLKGRSMNIFREDDFLDALKRIMDNADENEWYHINMICYNSYENHSFNNIDVFASLHEPIETAFDTILLYMSAEFDYFDLFSYIKESISINGDKYITKKDSIYTYPYSMTKEEWSSLIKFYNILSVKFISSTIGIKLNLPSI